MGQLLVASQNVGDADESVEEELAVGTYFVEVRANEQEYDRYSLSLTVGGEGAVDTPVAFEGPGNTIDLGDIAGVTSPTESADDYVDHLDTEQWYTFSLSRSREVDLRLLDVKLADSNGPLMGLWSNTGDRLHNSSIAFATYFANGERLPYPDRKYEYVDERLDAGTYYVRVVPHNYYTGEPMIEDRIRFTYKTRSDPASAPSGVTVRPAAEGMRVEWDAPLVHSDAVTGYLISRRLPDAQDRSYRVVLADTESQQTEHLDTMATTDATRYQYRVKALRGSVASDWSASAIGIYAAREAGDYSADTTTHGVVDVGGSTAGWIAEVGDVDYIKVVLEAGRHYEVVAEPREIGSWNLVAKLLEARDASDASASPLGHTRAFVTSVQYVLPEVTGDHFIVVAGGSTDTRYAVGPYTVSVQDVTSSAYQNLAEVNLPEADLDDGVSSESLSPDEWADLLESSDYLGAKPPYRYGRPIFDTVVQPSDHVGVVVPGGSTYGRLESPGGADLDGDGAVDLDVDIIKMNLEKDRLYRIDVEGQDTRNGTLADPRIISMRGPGQTYTIPNGDEDGGIGRNAVIFWTPTKSGDHYIAVISECCGYVPDGQSSESYRPGSYRVAVRDITPSPSPETADSSMPATVSVGDEYVGSLIAVGEVDWVAMELEAGHSYTISTAATYDAVLGMPGVGSVGIRTVRDEHDNILFSSVHCVDSVEFVPTANGRYFATVEENVVNSDSIGGYKVKLLQSSAARQILNTPATGIPTISGTVQVGETLTVNTSGIADADGLANATFTYQWIRNDGAVDTDISDATGGAYILVDDDEEMNIKVRVSFTDDAGNDETLTSAPTAVVAAGSSTGSIWSATLTAAELWQGYGYSNTAGSPTGSVTPQYFEIDGVTYTVKLIEASGWFYIGLDKEVPVEFTLDVDGTRLDSSDASFTSYTYAKVYYWADAGITWSEGSSVALSMNDSD